jgi:hypothetical protein
LNRQATIVVGVDQGVNLKVLRGLQRQGRVVLVQAHTLEQSFRQVCDQGKPFRLDFSALNGPDMFVDDNFEEVQRVIGKDKLADVEHVYASWLSKNDYFVTENVQDFVRAGRREQLGALLPDLRIRTTQELVRELDE